MEDSLPIVQILFANRLINRRFLAIDQMDFMKSIEHCCKFQRSTIADPEDTKDSFSPMFVLR